MALEGNTQTIPENILLIIADDMSAYMMGCAGSSFYHTPNLDRLAKKGIRFTQAYGTGPVCSPSRASLLTGKHPARLHLTNYTPGSVPENPFLLTPDWTPYLPESETTLANRFEGAGYATGHFGKWHLNRDYQHYPGRPKDPETQGFQEVFTTVKPKPDSNPSADPHNAAVITDHALRFIETHREKPFFCVVEHNLIHRPEIEAPERIAKYRKKPGATFDYQRPALGAMVERLDESIGKMIDKLEDLDLAKKTWLIFTADHGTPGDQDSKRPLHGAKASLYEGGIRVPLLVSRPETIPAGLLSDVPVTGADLAVTMASILPEVKAESFEDGVDFSPILRGERNGFPERSLFWHFPHYHHQGIAPCGAIRRGQFKLIEWFEPSARGEPLEVSCELYDLQHDPGETRNLGSSQTRLAEQLLHELDGWRKSVGAQSMSVNPDYNPHQPTRMSSPGH